MGFQLTASQGGWRVCNCYNMIFINYFNSQPHKEADDLPGGGNTADWHFNSQPHKEADPEPPEITFSENTFQLTASQGGWRNMQARHRRMFGISTHSLTRRLTFAGGRISWMVLHFNSQPHKEADVKPAEVHGSTWHFNSQPHKEADNKQQFFDKLIENFNSQPHKEADYRRLQTTWRTWWFQLTASQGGWPGISAGIQKRRVFQLTASQGGWPCCLTADRRRTHFNSQPHKEADLTGLSAWSSLFAFQLTASQGGWQQFQTKTYLSKTDFSTYYTY